MDWIITEGYEWKTLTCPYCNHWHQMINKNDEDYDWNFCPNCGKRIRE